MKAEPRALVLVALLLSGCAATGIPQLGLSENGRYYDAAARFACPVPGVEQDFAGPVRVLDAIASNDDFVPAARIEFIDSLHPARRISISFQSPEAGTDSSQAGFDSLGSARVVIGSTRLHQLPMKYAMLMQPYQQQGSVEPAELHLLANFVIPLAHDGGERHVQVRDSRAAAPLLSSAVDPADDDAVLHALRRRADSLRDIRRASFDWLRQCYWSTDSRSQ